MKELNELTETERAEYLARERQVEKDALRDPTSCVVGFVIGGLLIFLGCGAIKICITLVGQLIGVEGQ